MSGETRTLVDGVSAAWNKHDPQGFAAQFSEDGVLRVIATGDVLCGREQLKAGAEAYLRAFPDLRMERRSTYDCGETVCIIESTMKATQSGEFIGIPATQRSVELLTLLDFHARCRRATRRGDRLLRRGNSHGSTRRASTAR